MTDGEQWRARSIEQEYLAEVAPAPHEAEAKHERARTAEGARPGAAPVARFVMEMRDELPGGRAIIGVEQEGEFRWLGSRQHISDQACDELIEQLSIIVEQGLWVQNWTGR